MKLFFFFIPSNKDEESWVYRQGIG